MPKEVSKRLLLIVTGASRGFGRACAVELCLQHFKDTKIQAVLVGRSDTALEDTIQLLPSTVSVRKVVADLGRLEDLDSSIDEIMAATGDEEAFDDCLLINNAGSLGHIGSAMKAPSLRDMQATVDLNITSALWLSVRLARWCNSKNIKCTLVNVSSLVAIQPFATLAIYSAGKAARDAFHNSMAQDEDGDPAPTILNYAPGPLEATNMTQQLRGADDLHYTLKPHYQKKLVDVNDSAKALVKLLESNNFTNGQHVDYYDLVVPDELDSQPNEL